MAEEEVTRAPSTIPQFVWRNCEIIIGGVFIYAGAIKALDPIRFANDIDNYKIFAVDDRCPARVLFALAGNLLRTRIDRAPTLSRGIIDLDRACLHLRHRDRFRKNPRPRHQLRLLRSRQQNWTLPAHLALDFRLADLSSLALTSRARTRRREFARKVDV